MEKMTPSVVASLSNPKKFGQWVDQNYVVKVYGKLYFDMIRVVNRRLRKENPAVIYSACVGALDDLIQTLDFGDKFMDEQHRLGPIGQVLAKMLNERQPVA